MKFKIPFTLSSAEALKKKAGGIAKYARTGKKAFYSLENYLKDAETSITKDEYIAISLKTFLYSFIMLSIIFIFILGILRIRYFYLYGIAISLLFSFFVLFSQLSYPKIYSLRKAREIEKNLIPALQDILVQLNSGIPIFNILVNIAASDYGILSKELGKAVREITSGKPQLEAIDELGNRTSSLYFKRTLWQISNGMRSGSDISIVIKDNIDNLSKEQVIQLQSYGNKLNPLVMFYMLLTVILPVLALTFLIIISSMLNLSDMMIKLIFASIFIFVVLLQIMFLGMLKTRRPSLL